MAGRRVAYKYLERSREVYRISTDLWDSLVSDKKKRGGHPGVEGNSSGEEFDEVLGYLGGALRSLRDIRGELNKKGEL